MLDDPGKRLPRTSETAEADIREDEEQAKRFRDIVDLLLAAGYFRARIKGLSNFDKVIGGMTWCIESCNFDVDVDLLFRENLTIGQKIALTEKIVAMLPKMNCPHRIEPHQVQGLDCIHIFPVVQWLVKRSMETREETAEFVRSFALDRFDKRHTFADDAAVARAIDENLRRNIQLAKKSYEPRRLFKQKDGAKRDEDAARFLATVLEYEAPLCPTQVAIAAHTAPKNAELPLQQNRDRLSESLAMIEESSTRLSLNAVGNIVGIQAQEIARAAEKYASVASTSGSEETTAGATASSAALVALQKQRCTLENRVRKLTKERDGLASRYDESRERLNESRAKRRAIERSLRKAREMGIDEKDSTYKRLGELLSVHDGLKQQEQSFREQCKSDLNALRSKLQETASGAASEEEEEDRSKEHEEQREAVTRARLQLAKKNRTIASLTRQLDDVPGRSELTQYQRRFMELYNQVSAKHKETKQYYTLYNTLDDTKLYLTKELSLLDSIQDNYNEAMASASGREQFLRQFEAIVAGVKRNKAKAEKRCADEKNRRDALSRQLITLIEQQRKYVAAVRQLTVECRKNEALLAQLRDTYSRGA